MKVVISIDNGEVISTQADGEGVEVLVVEGPECNIQSFKAEFAPTAVRVVQGLRSDVQLRAS